MGAGGAGAWAEEKWAGAGWEGKLERPAREWRLTRVLGCRRYSLTDMHDIKDVVKTDILTGENPDEKKEAAKAVRKAFMTRCGSLSTLSSPICSCRGDARPLNPSARVCRFQEGKNKWFFSKLRF